jgi:16S rRNA (cytidine1402-2'-O)-methyltransferase
VVVDRAAPVQASAQTVEDALRDALKILSSKDAATQVAQAFGLTRRDVYQLALTLGQRP